MDTPPFSRVFVVCSKHHREEEIRAAFQQYGLVEDVWMVKVSVECSESFPSPISIQLIEDNVIVVFVQRASKSYLGERLVFSND